MSSKNNNKISVSFCGTNANDVTGSCLYIKTSNRNILIECGLYQSCKSTLENYHINNAKFDFKSKDIDYVFVPHLHADHSLRVPLIFKRGGTPRVIGVSNTKILYRVLLEDSARIASSDVGEIQRKTGKSYDPLYDQDDVECCLSHYEEFPIGEPIQLDEYVKFQFIPSAHIINSAQLILWIKDGNLTKKIVYTSDLGNTHVEKYYTNKFEFDNKCDLFVGETTYAGQEKIATSKTRKHDIEKLKSDIYETCVENKSRLMIPVFAMDRCQNMLTYVYNIMHDNEELSNIPVYVDSPMAVRMCGEYLKILKGKDFDLWQDVLSWKNINFIIESEDSKAVRDSHRPCVVLSSSGMIIARGRSSAWACSMLPREKDRIVFCGYSAEGSIGSIIKEGKQKSITINGKRYKNRCQVTNLTSFTSHIQRDAMLSYYGNVEAQKLFLVHGNMDGKISFAKELKQRLSNNNLNTKVVVAQKGMEVLI